MTDTCACGICTFGVRVPTNMATVRAASPSNELTCVARSRVCAMSEYAGVSKIMRGGRVRWQAQHERKYIGIYDTESEAAQSVAEVAGWDTDASGDETHVVIKSNYHNVQRKGMKWTAHFQNKYLGGYDDEKEAAAAVAKMSGKSVESLKVQRSQMLSTRQSIRLFRVQFELYYSSWKSFLPPDLARQINH